MRHIFRNLKIILFLLSNLFLISHSQADNHNIYEIIDQLQKDIKTLEKAVYSGSIELNTNSPVSVKSNLDNKEDTTSKGGIFQFLQANLLSDTSS